MSKTILITGSTDGIGFEAAKSLAAQGHHVLLHGRNPSKLKAAAAAVGGNTHTYIADLSRLSDAEAMAQAVIKDHDHLDVLINNAGVYKTAHPVTAEGLDVRFVVNTIVPYLLTQRLLPIMDAVGRVINLSSAAQASVDAHAFQGEVSLSAGAAYAQSKLAITMWSRHLAEQLNKGPVVIAVNPGSLLGTKMVKEGYGMEGKDIRIGSDILTRLALDSEFTNASGQYFDNDIGRFGPPHPDALDPKKSKKVVGLIEAAIAKLMK